MHTLVHASVPLHHPNCTSSIFSDSVSDTVTTGFSYDKSLYTSVEIDNDIAIKLYQKYGFVIKSSFEYAIEDVTYKEFRMIKEIW